MKSDDVLTELTKLSFQRSHWLFLPYGRRCYEYNKHSWQEAFFKR